MNRIVIVYVATKTYRVYADADFTFFPADNSKVTDGKGKSIEFYDLFSWG
jgi:hypothetical protein